MWLAGGLVLTGCLAHAGMAKAKASTSDFENSSVQFRPQEGRDKGMGARESEQPAGEGVGTRGPPAPSPSLGEARVRVGARDRQGARPPAPSRRYSNILQNVRMSPTTPPHPGSSRDGPTFYRMIECHSLPQPMRGAWLQAAVQAAACGIHLARSLSARFLQSVVGILASRSPAFILLSPIPLSSCVRKRGEAREWGQGNRRGPEPEAGGSQSADGSRQARDRAHHGDSGDAEKKLPTGFSPEQGIPLLRTPSVLSVPSVPSVVDLYPRAAAEQSDGSGVTSASRRPAKRSFSTSMS